ncbi:MAG: tRNA (adenosine(37)-N6)-threonylcarbamoyltransferase complex ATPase subunit type 1 TsaE [Erysipelothrix sp.]|jgi:tRNA threonylcarbamoyladenosine biosynthesis protein TsaE|nr:tRNA (adenosine(37)-N6)-threonylcarbamoyltransferase complex ATPase subunit type 1 TsaE [Erysipelothrix sp.]
MKKMITYSKTETQKLAQSLGEKLQKGCVLCLSGELGAGKTTFTQGLAKGLDIHQNVNSPTFVMMKEYEGRLTLIHIDAYRLEGISQDLGFEDYFDDEHVCVIEWSEFVQDYLPDDAFYITINRLDENVREIILNLNQELEAQLC